MNTILTPEDIERHIGYRLPAGAMNLLLGLIAERKAAVLAKLREQEPQDRERWLAVREGHFNAASAEYFNARQHLDTPENRRIFYAGHCKGYDAAPLPAVAQVPPGYKLVPVEPTDKMVQAAHHLDLSYMPGQEGADRAAIYRAMLAAAPEAPAQGIHQQIEQARQNVAQWPQWMKDGTSAAELRLPEAPAQLPRGECFTNGNICARCGHSEFIEAQAIPAPWREAVKVAREATEKDAYEMGAKGAPATEQERKLFEAWMRGHCWALRAHWNGSGYVSDAEQGGDLDPRAMVTRQLWAAWRDRAALAQLDALEGGE